MLTLPFLHKLVIQLYSLLIPIIINSLSILLVKTAHFLVVNFVKETAVKELTSFG